MKKVILDDILLESKNQNVPAPGAGCGSGCGCGTSTQSARTQGACGSATPISAPNNFIALSSITSTPKLPSMAETRAKMESRLEGKKGPQFWRSLNELAQSPEFEDAIAREWKSAPASWNGVSRRDFLKFAGASLALAGLAGCAQQPEERIFPYVKQPEDMIPGRPLFFATAASKSAAPGFGYAVGVLGESHMGRPTKLEGNPDHPSSLGSSDAITQATLYTLYDPDRSQNATKNGENSTWDAAKGELFDLAVELKKTRGAGLAILSEAITSPTLAAQMQELMRLYPQAKQHSWNVVNRDSMRAALGKVDAVYDFSKAKVIVSLDSNFFADEPGSIRYAREFADGRRVHMRHNKTAMNRLYVVESTPSITGANADHRWSVKASEVVNFARAMGQAFGAHASSNPSTSSVPENALGAIVKDLFVNRGASIIIAGQNQPAEVHALTHQMNVALGNVGKTVTYVEPVEANPVVHLYSLKSLVDDMNAGHVSTLVILGANPVYTAPADLKFVDALKKVKTRVRLGLYNDETSDWCQWHLPLRHYLEDWSDARAHDGTATIVQPLIAPMYDGVSAHQLLAVLTAGEDRNPYHIVRDYWKARIKPTDFEAWWRKVLNDGIVPNTAARPHTGTIITDGGPSPSAPLVDGLEINFFPDPHIWDGAHSNNGWLQELPKPMNKMTWDNTALVSLKTSRDLGLNNYDLVKLTANGNTVEAPVWILPGQPDGQVTVHLGYGRTRVGQMGNGAGFDAYQLRSSQNMWFSGGAQIEKAGRQVRLAMTQENHMIDNRHRPSQPGLQHEENGVTMMDSFHDRDLLRVVPIADFLKDPKHSALEAEIQRHKEAGTPEPAVSEAKTAARREADEKSTPPEPGSAEDESIGSPYEPNIMPRIWPSDRQGIDKNGVPIYGQEKKGYAGNPIPAWGMSIDLNTCIGCNACTVACQAENNIATVGKDQVVRGREMHWIRVDRYYRGDVENPETYHQPVPCMQCEKAPCEPVCPVEATTHSVEGINEMTYNRCVGTKYCSNNCPYKVRRFNFLQYSEQDNVSLMEMRNPDVTVRARGVMEKCNYCIQRINEARVQAEKEDRPIRDGEFTTACAQTCPTKAIVFGNMQDKQSELYDVKAEPHNYGLLPELNTFPRTTYLAKFKNPNPALKEES